MRQAAACSLARFAARPCPPPPARPPAQLHHITAAPSAAQRTMPRRSPACCSASPVSSPVRHRGVEAPPARGAARSARSAASPPPRCCPVCRCPPASQQPRLLSFAAQLPPPTAQRPPVRRTRSTAAPFASPARCVITLHRSTSILVPPPKMPLHETQHCCRARPSQGIACAVVSCPQHTHVPNASTSSSIATSDVGAPNASGKEHCLHCWISLLSYLSDLRAGTCSGQSG